MRLCSGLADDRWRCYEHLLSSVRGIGHGLISPPQGSGSVQFVAAELFSNRHLFISRRNGELRSSLAVNLAMAEK